MSGLAILHEVFGLRPTGRVILKAKKVKKWLKGHLTKIMMIL